MDSALEYIKDGWVEETESSFINSVSENIMIYDAGFSSLWRVAGMRSVFAPCQFYFVLRRQPRFQVNEGEGIRRSQVLCTGVVPTGVKKKGRSNKL